MRSRSVFLAAVSFAVAIIGLSGCTASGSEGGATGATASGAAVAGATYSAAQLSRMLDRASVKLGVTGTLVGDAELKDMAGRLGGAQGLGRLLGEGKVTYSPVLCGSLITDALSGGTPKDTIAAQLTAGSTTITVATNDGKPLSEAQKSSWVGPLDKMLNECGHLTMRFDLAGVKTTADTTIKRITTSTKADVTVGVEQTTIFSLGDETVSAVNTVVHAISGNLFITVMNTRTNQATEWDGTEAAPAPVDAVNAVVASAAE